MPLTDAEVIANIVDPDQTAPSSGSALFALTNMSKDMAVHTLLPV